MLNSVDWHLTFQSLPIYCECLCTSYLYDNQNLICTSIELQNRYRAAFWTMRKNASQAKAQKRCWSEDKHPCSVFRGTQANRLNLDLSSACLSRLGQLGQLSSRASRQCVVLLVYLNQMQKYNADVWIHGRCIKKGKQDKHKGIIAWAWASIWMKVN